MSNGLTKQGSPSIGNPGILSHSILKDSHQDSHRDSHQQATGRSFTFHYFPFQYLDIYINSALAQPFAEEQRLSIYSFDYLFGASLGV